MVGGKTDGRRAERLRLVLAEYQDAVDVDVDMDVDAVDTEPGKVDVAFGDQPQPEPPSTGQWAIRAVRGRDAAPVPSTTRKSAPIAKATTEGAPGAARARREPRQRRPVELGPPAWSAGGFVESRLEFTENRSVVW